MGAPESKSVAEGTRFPNPEDALTSQTWDALSALTWRNTVGPPPVDPMAIMTPAEYEIYLSHAQVQFAARYARNQCPKAKTADLTGEAFLGSGAFGSVYLVRHRQHEEELALKILRKKELRRQERSNAGTIKVVMKEKTLTYALQNKFIYRLLYGFQDSKNLYMIFERAQYGDLRAVSEPSEPIIRRFAAQIVLALEYVHKCSIIHRDIKLENVLIFEDFYVKLCDFGIAKRLTAARLYRAYSMAGDGRYLSPQHYGWLGYGKDFDFWLLGSLIFELTYGHPPFFQDDWDNERIEKAVVEGRIPFYLVNRLTPLNTFISGLLEKRVSDRLGVSSGGILRVKQHVWFNGVDFNAIFNKFGRENLEGLREVRDPIEGNFRDEVLGTPLANYKEFADF